MKLEALASLPLTLDLGDYVLRALRRDDAPALYAYLSDPEVTRLTSYDIRSVDDVAKMIDRCIAGYAQKSSNRWALARKGSDVLVGTCGFYWWDGDHSIAELGYDLSRDCWGKGLMTRAVRAAVCWAFDSLEINRIQATVMVGNIASARVLEKCGFQKEGMLRDYKLCRGHPRDFWMFSQLRRDYIAG